MKERTHLAGWARIVRRTGSPSLAWSRIPCGQIGVANHQSCQSRRFGGIVRSEAVALQPYSEDNSVGHSQGAVTHHAHVLERPCAAQKPRCEALGTSTLAPTRASAPSAASPEMRVHLHFPSGGHTRATLVGLPFPLAHPPPLVRGTLLLSRISSCGPCPNPLPRPVPTPSPLPTPNPLTLPTAHPPSLPTPNPPNKPNTPSPAPPPASRPLHHQPPDRTTPIPTANPCTPGSIHKAGP